MPSKCSGGMESFAGHKCILKGLIVVLSPALEVTMKKSIFVLIAAAIFPMGVSAQEPEVSLQELQQQILSTLQTVSDNLDVIESYTRPDCTYAIPAFILTGPLGLGSAPPRLPSGPNPSFDVPLVITKKQQQPHSLRVSVGPAPEATEIMHNPGTVATVNMNVAVIENSWLPKYSIATYPSGVVDCFVISLGTRMATQDKQQLVFTQSILTRQEHSEAAFKGLVAEEVLKLSAQLESLEARFKDIEEKLDSLAPAASP